MVRRESVDGHDTIFATLTPKDRARPQTDDGKIMRHFKARAWISESDYELVRVEIEAIDDLSFGLGLLARVHKGTVATYQRRKVDNEAWLPQQVTWTASARVLLLRRLRLRGVFGVFQLPQVHRGHVDDVRRPAPLVPTLSLRWNWAGNMLLGEPLDGAGNLISGCVGDMRQLRELPPTSAFRFGFPTVAGHAPLAQFAATACVRPSSRLWN